jgi:hypothetical protein
MVDRVGRVALACQVEVRRHNIAQTIKSRGTLMSNEFEKLAALLHLSEPSERAPQIDRVEAAKLAARWGRLVHRAREQSVQPQMRRPQLGARS